MRTRKSDSYSSCVAKYIKYVHPANPNQAVTSPERPTGLVLGDTGVVLITPRTMPDLSSHPRGDRISEVFAKAIDLGKPSIQANFWGYYA